MTSRAIQNPVAATTDPSPTLATRSVDFSTVVIERVATSERSTMDTVRAFHRRGSQFLGPMPGGAFEEYAGGGGLIVARSAHEAIGYALFAVTDRYVRLIHLFVDDPWRRAGVARRLVLWISEAHRDRPGILVKSRRDHARADVWARLGFVRRAERPGRGRDHVPLAIWWRDHGLPGLFTPTFEGVRVRAAVDINILRDRVEVGRAGREASLALTADHLSDQLALFRTPTLEIEIERLADPDRRRQATAEAGGLADARIDDERRRRALAELRRARQAAGPKAREVSDEDLGYLSEAIGAGLDVFVTKDARLAAILRDAAGAEGLRILRPEEVIVRIDELARSAAYHPRSFEGTELTTHLLGPGDHDRLLPLASTNQGESRAMFTDRVAGLTRQGYERFVVEGPDGSMMACIFWRAEGTLLDVALFRVRNDSMGPTLARQLLFRLRQDALVAHATAIRVADPRPSRPVPAAMEEDGYLMDRGTWTTLVLDVAGSTEQVGAAISAAERLASIAPSPPIRGTLTIRQAADIEQAGMARESPRCPLADVRPPDSAGLRDDAAERSARAVRAPDGSRHEPDACLLPKRARWVAVGAIASALVSQQESRMPGRHRRHVPAR